VLSAPALPSILQGKIISLSGQQFVARVAGDSGSALNLRADLRIDPRAGAVTGSLAAEPSGSGGG
jgi:hypothetical protein